MKFYDVLWWINHYLSISFAICTHRKTRYIFESIDGIETHKISNSLRLPWECRHFLDVCNISRSTSLSPPQQSHRLSRGRSPTILSDKFRNGRRECVVGSGRNNKRETALILCPAMTSNFFGRRFPFVPVFLRPSPARRKDEKVFPEE